MVPQLRVVSQVVQWVWTGWGREVATGASGQGGVAQAGDWMRGCRGGWSCARLNEALNERSLECFIRMCAGVGQPLHSV